MSDAAFWACDHESHVRGGEIRCRKCGARYFLDIGWSGWVPKATKSQAGKMGGRPRGKGGQR